MHSQKTVSSREQLLPNSFRSSLAITTILAVALFMAPAAQAQYTVIHNFTGGDDGATPYGGLTIDGAGHIYGTASAGGQSGNGTVFKMTPHNSAYILTTLYGFGSGHDGNTPTSGVTRDSNGLLYGVTFGGGASGAGTVYKLSPPPTAGGGAAAPWRESILYNFTGGSDGYGPDMIGGYLRFDAHGNLYGTTLYGGLASCPDGFPGCGTVFELTPSGGGWTQSVLHTFTGSPNDGANPFGDVILDSGGNIDGTTAAGGSNNPPFGFGVLYRLSPSGSGYSETFVYSFCGPFSCLDGSAPLGGPALDNSQNVFAASSNAADEFLGGIDLNVLDASLCCDSYGDLILDASGNLYGTLSSGGASGYGAVFKLTPNGGSWTYTSLHDFTGGADGGQPYGTLAFDNAGNLYGTASIGGSGVACSGGCGVVFKIAP